MMSGEQRCNKNHNQCSKPIGHHGRCNKEWKLSFWKKSVLKSSLKKDCADLLREKDELESSNFDTDMLCIVATIINSFSYST